MKKGNIQILPITNKVVFPYQSIRIQISEAKFSEIIYNNTLGLVPMVVEDNLETSSQQQEQLKQLSTNTIHSVNSQNNISGYGTLIRVISEDKFISASNQTESFIKNIIGVGIARFKIISLITNSSDQHQQTKLQQLQLASIEILKDEIPLQDEKYIRDLSIIQNLRELGCQYIDLNTQKADISELKKDTIQTEENIVRLTYFIASQIEISAKEKLELLKMNKIEGVINEIILHLNKLINDLKITKDVQQKITEKISKETRNMFLKETIEAINDELYGTVQDDITQIEKSTQKGNLPENVNKVVLQELKKLKNMGQQNPEYNVILTYLQTIVDLPWNIQSRECKNLRQADEILRRDHAGLEKVKKRIIEFLAVKQLKQDSKGSIICLLGPPGVGKTSLGKSIAQALERKFYRVALGGVSDETEIRGHRTTYVGAQPGIFIQALKRVKTNNPVILIDEIDKISRDIRGDPSAALLEVLDPSQNNNFTDHYLGIPFDLSNVMFIVTANTLDTIQPALLDRLEIISIPGYTFQEKFEIATKYLIPKQIEENGINSKLFEITKETLMLLINNYTNEAGVRELDRIIGTICRKVAFQYSIHKSTKKSDESFIKLIITPDVCQNFLGAVIYENDVRERISQPGVAIGLAWTQAGGKLLYVEASCSKGRGNLQITGKLGEAMKESVKTALGWIKSNFYRININTPYFEQLLSNSSKTNNNNKQFVYMDTDLINKIDIHVHFPSASVPKDGPSAGVTIISALISVFTQCLVRSDIAMTGEITLKGLVLPVGGIKEKCLAAHGAGIRRILLPTRNKKDLEDISKDTKKDIDFCFVNSIEDVLSLTIGPTAINEDIFLKYDRTHYLQKNSNTKLSKL